MFKPFVAKLRSKGASNICFPIGKYLSLIKFGDETKLQRRAIAGSS